jgi:integrase
MTTATTTSTTTKTTTTTTFDNNSDYDKKVKLATTGLQDYSTNLLKRQSNQNAMIIIDYLLALNIEINASLNYKSGQLRTLCYLSEFCKQKSFIEMTRDDILAYLDSIKRPEESDSLHKWIGTYNLRRIYFLRFFKWLYYPTLHSDKRPTPNVMENISQFKRKETSIYKPTDLWTDEDDALFLKYCPNIRDRCYHMISRDSSCRPGEILNLRIRDVVFKTTGGANNHQYAEILVNGKTGTRHIPLLSSLPYVKDWIDSHPQRGNQNSYLIPSFDRHNRKFGNKMKTSSLNVIYNKHKTEFFPSLLLDPKVTPEDKKKITELLKKPWNPYIRRHSALTEKSRILKEHVLRQHAGWSGRSQMHLKYLHYFGNESSESLLEAYGILPKDQQLGDALKPKQCPNCMEPNRPDSKFCSKCRMVLSYDAYNETLEEQKSKELEKDNEVKKLKVEIMTMMEEFREQQRREFQKGMMLAREGFLQGKDV